MKKIFLATVIYCVVCQLCMAQSPPVLSQREQSKLIDDVLEDRLRTVLPKLMRREGVDMWVIISSENNEDPVFNTMTPASWMSAQRTVMLVIFDRGEGKETDYIAISHDDFGKVFKKVWDPVHQPDQWAQLAKVITERNPAKVAINRSEHFHLADGISSTEYEQLKKVLHKKPAEHHIISGERLAIAWLETRSEREMALYQQICKLTHDIVQEGFSQKVIIPGITTTDDVAWWFREKVKDMKLDLWFHPVVSVQRNEAEATFAKRTQPLVIMPGDLLHIDFGIVYLRLHSKVQQHFYVLRSGETDAPDFLKKTFARANKFQDIVTRNFVEGKTGNQILAESRKQAMDQSLTPTMYAHPIGFHGHGAGFTAGLEDSQNGVPHIGEYLLHNNTVYSMGLGVTVFIIEWKKEVQIRLQENGYFDENGFSYIDGRQTELLTIPRVKSLTDN